MNFKKIALITCINESSWQSCKSIRSNLEKYYSEIFSEKNIYHHSVSRSLNFYTAQKLASELLSLEIELIVWLDHKPSPAIFLNALENVFKEVTKKPNLMIHAYGDFTLDCLTYRDAVKGLLSWPLHFVAASLAQKKLIESFFESDAENVSVLPFPVDGQIFNLDNFETNRIQIRKELEIPTNAKVLIYTGRISFQKNIDQLIKIFENINSVFGNEMYLIIAGPWDNILVPYSGKRGFPGSYFSHLTNQIDLKKIPNVIFTGNLKSNDLVKLYHAADSYISLSTYNDEDFGMSPAEALCTGLPCFLTKWGGFSSFKDYSSVVKLNPVEIKKRAEFDLNKTRSELIKFLMETKSDLKNRTSNRNEVITKLTLKELIKESGNKNYKFSHFKNLTKKFYRLCELSKLYPGAPFRDRNLDYSPFYKEVYDVYCD